jgi:subtilisin
MAGPRGSSDKPGETKSARSRGAASVPSEASPAPSATVEEIVLFLREGAEADALQYVLNALGDRAVARSDDFADGALLVDQLPPDALVLYSQLGIALVRTDPAQVQDLQSRAASAVFLEEVIVADSSPLQESSEAPPPEALPSGDSPRIDYVKGYRDAVDNLARVAGIRSETEGTTAQDDGAPTEFQDDDHGTWGLHATGVLASRFTGRDVRVAALVDGLDTAHPDWTGRQMTLKSFVPNEPPTAFGTSGTHYLGTAFGPLKPSAGPRYGCAPDAVPYVAKVLASTGGGSRAAILAGIEWAVTSQCRIILAPLGWGGPAHDAAFELFAARASARGALLVAGAGSNAERSQGNYGYVVNPAACPSVLGSGSINPRVQLPQFTPRSSIGPSGVVGLVAPGVDLRSSIPGPQLYTRWSGSATAAAYAAGIAALWAEAQPKASSRELWQALVSSARPLGLPAWDVGAGLVRAP